MTRLASLFVLLGCLLAPACAVDARTTKDCSRGPLAFMHIPKAGTFFQPLVWKYGCPGAHDDKLKLRMIRRWGFNLTDFSSLSALHKAGECPCLAPREVSSWQNNRHHDLVTNVTDIPSLAALFRQPASRAASAFDYGLSTKWFSGSLNIANRSGLAATIAALVGNRQAQLQAFACWPGVKSTATQMLLGSIGGGGRSFNARDVAKASRYVERLAFVGLTECAAESVALFDARFGTTASKHAIQKYRSSEVDHSSTDVGHCEDKPDNAVFMAAVARFQRDYKKMQRDSHAPPRISPSCAVVIKKWSLKPQGANQTGIELSGRA